MGFAVGLTKYPIGHKAYIYKPPTQTETIARGRKAKHIDHYFGPGTITSQMRMRSMVISLNGREFQRDVGMVLLEKPKIGDHDPTIRDRTTLGVQQLTEENQQIDPLQEGEFIIIKDNPQLVKCYPTE
jgi:hypothetical protein